LGKTIIFARNHKHAKLLVEIFNERYPQYGGDFCLRIDNYEPRAEQLIDDFKADDGSQNLTIAVSVDMLDTGIDVPEVVNLVFFKIVRSKTKFWQMIGRGTRLCPDLFGPEMHKEKFLVFDFCQNFEFFNQNPNTTDGALAPSISEKLFVARVDLMDEIAKAQEPSEDGLIGLKDSIEQRLYDEVMGMNIDNFIVRPARRYVEKFQTRDAWRDINIEDRLELTEHVAGLPSALKDDELEAKQFDYLVLLAQLALLRRDAAFVKYQERIQAIASSLEELGNVPMVAAQMALILEIQTNEYWEGVTLAMLEEVRRKLRGLVKLIEPASRKIVYTDFQDEIGEGSDVVLPDIGNGTDKARFMMKVRHFLQRHGDHITLQKLRRNEQLTKQDIDELERIFLEEGVADDVQLDGIRSEGGLGLLIRSLVGLDREAAKEAFSSFIDGRTLTANQIEFISLVIDHLTERGVLDPRRLYESPFTDIDDQGVSGIFELGDVKELVNVINEVKARAAA
jgi:type I restriction enzyme R subunit